MEKVEDVPTSPEIEQPDRISEEAVGVVTSQDQPTPNDIDNFFTLKNDAITPIEVAPSSPIVITESYTPL